jgi:hypothetical protein
MIYKFTPKQLQRHTVHQLHPVNSNRISVILRVRLHTLLTHVDSKMDFMRLQMNYSKRCSRWRFPQRVSIAPNILVGVWRAECPVYQVSTRECSSLLQSCDMAMMWRVATSGYAEVWLSTSLALGTRLASGLSRARQKYVFVPYRELAYVKVPFPITNWHRYFTPLGIESINLQQPVMQCAAR